MLDIFPEAPHPKGGSKRRAKKRKNRARAKAARLARRRNR